MKIILPGAVIALCVSAGPALAQTSSGPAQPSQTARPAGPAASAQRVEPAGPANTRPGSPTDSGRSVSPDVAEGSTRARDTSATTMPTDSGPINSTSPNSGTNTSAGGPATSP